MTKRSSGGKQKKMDREFQVEGQHEVKHGKDLGVW